MRTSTATFWPAADALEVLLDQHAQDLALRLQRHVGDLVDVERAAVRFLESADLARPAGAILGAEQLLLDAVGRHGRGVEHDERPVGAMRLAMDDARGELLAGARRAADQDAAVGRRDACRCGPRSWLIAADLPIISELAVERSRSSLDLAPQLRGFERAQRHEHQPVGLERLLDVVVGAALDRGDGGLDVAVAGDDDDRQIGMRAS